MININSYRFGTTGEVEIIVPEGLVAFYPLNETSGNEAIDLINGNNGIHGQDLAAEKPPVLLGAGGYGFPTLNEIVKIPDSDLLSFEDGVNDLPFSIRALVKFTDLTTTYQFIIFKGVSTREYELSWQSGSLVFRIYTEGRNNRYRQIAIPFDLAADTDYHLNQEYDVIAVYEGGTSFKFYINAVSGGNYSSSGAWVRMYNTTNSLFLGRLSTTNAYSFHGSMRGIRIYNRAITAAEVEELNNNGNPHL